MHGKEGACSYYALDRFDQRLDDPIDRTTVGIMTASLVIGSSIVMTVHGGTREFALGRRISNLRMRIESQRECSAVGSVSAAAGIEWGCD